jgi:hypothetical protein
LDALTIDKVATRPVCCPTDSSLSGTLTLSTVIGRKVLYLQSQIKTGAVPNRDYTGATMKRPIPVILTAVLLGLFAALQLLGTILMTVVGFVALHKGLPSTPGAQPFPPSMMPVLFFGTSLLSTALAVWFILTLIGLVRLRSWARYSLLAIAGLMAGFGGIAMLSSFAMPFLMPSMPAAANQPAADPSILRTIFFMTGAVYGLVTALGVALLVYYNLAKTRALFLMNAPVNVGPPKTSTGRPRPTAVTVISWIYLISAPFCLIYTFLPFPAFLFGFILHGLAAHLMYLFFGALTFAIGYGLLRLRNEARVAMFALFALLPIQTVVMLTPWGARQFRLCMDEMNTAMYGGRYTPPNLFASPGIIVFFMLLSMALYAVVLWLLHRHRAAFTPIPPAPSLPTYPELLAE